MKNKILVMFISIILMNIFINNQFQLHFDEAYYWAYGQNLSLSYYDHPPMIAYIIYLTSMLGSSELFVRLATIITTTITVITVYALTKKMFDNKVANIVVLLLLACPLIEGIFFIVTIDSPLIMFWALTLYAFYLGVFENKIKFVYLSGFFAGCGLLSKYTAILIFPSLFIFLITSKEYRHLLHQKHLYLSFVLAWIVFLPVIIWNYQNHWVSFIYQFKHGTSQTRIIHWQFLGEYIGGTILILGPILLIALLYYSLRYIKINLSNSKLSFLWWSYISVFLIFAYLSLFNHIEINWIAPISISGSILLAYWLSTKNNRWVYRSSLILIFIVLLFTKFPLTFIPSAYHGKVPQVSSFYGHKELLLKVKPYLDDTTKLFACDYGNASLAWYYLHLKKAYVLPESNFANAYRYWDLDIKTPIHNAIYICDHEDNNAKSIINKHFKTVKLIESITFTNSLVEYTEYIYQANN